MDINDMKQLTEEIIDNCYESDEEICWLPFEILFDSSEFDEDIVKSIKKNLNKHKDVIFCDIWNYCFFIRVHKFSEQEEEFDW
jgi:energy-converting hydrogenase A subunit M